MTKATLGQETLSRLRVCAVLADQNLGFYECLYDALGDQMIERETIGQAMGQKQSFLGAVQAIFKNHDVAALRFDPRPEVSERETPFDPKRSGQHLAQEEAFQDALRDSIASTTDAVLVELLEHHLKAADFALSAIKATSLKL